MGSSIAAHRVLLIAKQVPKQLKPLSRIRRNTVVSRHASARPIIDEHPI